MAKPSRRFVPVSPCHPGSPSLLVAPRSSLRPLVTPPPQSLSPAPGQPAAPHVRLEAPARPRPIAARDGLPHRRGSPRPPLRRWARRRMSGCEVQGPARPRMRRSSSRSAAAATRPLGGLAAWRRMCVRGRWCQSAVGSSSHQSSEAARSRPVEVSASVLRECRLGLHSSHRVGDCRVSGEQALRRKRWSRHLESGCFDRSLWQGSAGPLCTSMRSLNVARGIRRLRGRWRDWSALEVIVRHSSHLGARSGQRVGQRRMPIAPGCVRSARSRHGAPGEGSLEGERPGRWTEGPAGAERRARARAMRRQPQRAPRHRLARAAAQPAPPHGARRAGPTPRTGPDARRWRCQASSISSLEMPGRPAQGCSRARLGTTGSGAVLSSRPRCARGPAV